VFFAVLSLLLLAANATTSLVSGRWRSSPARGPCW
jgi:hypothetical protein